MHNSFSNILPSLEKFTRQGKDRQALERGLWQEIIAAVSTRKVIKTRYSSVQFHLEYDDHAGEIPSYVLFRWKGEEHRFDFVRAALLLFEYMISGIEMKNLYIIHGLANPLQEERSRFIRFVLGQYILHNRIFRKTMKEEDRVPMQSFATSGEESDHADRKAFENWYEDYWAGAHDTPGDEPGQEAKALQKEAWFWCPGEKYQGMDIQAKQGVYIGFLYAWLRRISGAALDEIAMETGVNKSNVCRWKPEDPLDRPFPLMNPWEVIFPVEMEEGVRNDALKLNRQKVRCFRGTRDNTECPGVQGVKGIIWDIYETMGKLLEYRDYILQNAHRGIDLKKLCPDTPVQKFRLRVRKGRAGREEPVEMVFCIRSVKG